MNQLKLKESQIKKKIVTLVLFLLLGFALLVAYGWTPGGSWMLLHKLLNPIVNSVGYIVISAPVTSLMAIVCLVWSAISTRKGQSLNFIYYLWIFNLDILALYIVFWLLIISLFQSQDVIYLAKRPPLVETLAVVLVLSILMLGREAYKAKHWHIQGSALFLLFLVSGALFLTVHALQMPYQAPTIMARYPSPDKKYTILKYQETPDPYEGYALQVQNQHQAAKLGSCAPTFIRWIDNNTMLVFADGRKQKVVIRDGNVGKVDCPID